MNDLDKPITINPQAIILARDKAGNLALSQEAERRAEERTGEIKQEYEQRLEKRNILLKL